MKKLSEFIKTELEVQENIKTELEQYLKISDGYTIHSEVKWGTTSRGMRFDLVVEYNNSIIAIFEIKHSERGVNIAKNNMLNYVMCNTPAEFFIIYNIAKNEYLVFSKESENAALISLKNIAYKIKDIAENKYKKEENTDSDKIKKGLRFYENSEKILDPEFCREKLGKSFSGREVCRYSSLESIFSTLKFKTLRMNGLPGMNDKTEGLFAWNLLNKLESMMNEEGRKRKREMNNAFIVSFSKDEKIDNLDMWRLYGDDAKGVCCIYSVLKDKIKDRFFLHDIKYINNNDESEINDSHLEHLRKYIESQNTLTYLDLSPSIFFYKPKDFENEQEVRLLVDNKKTTAYNNNPYKREWVLTSANKIPNPYIDISLDEIPLKLEKIILGPNMNDIDTIQVQLEAMLEQQNIKASVEPSKIDVYRNPNS